MFYLLHIELDYIYIYYIQVYTWDRDIRGIHSLEMKNHRSYQLGSHEMIPELSWLCLSIGAFHSCCLLCLCRKRDDIIMPIVKKWAYSACSKTEILMEKTRIDHVWLWGSNLLTPSKSTQCPLFCMDPHLDPHLGPKIAMAYSRRWSVQFEYDLMKKTIPLI